MTLNKKIQREKLKKSCFEVFIKFVPNSPLCRCSYTLKQPPWLHFFGHCFLISELTKMIRTILESTDHAEKVAKTFGASKWLSHTLKMRFAEKVLFFGLLNLTFLVVVTSLVDLQKCYTPF